MFRTSSIILAAVNAVALGVTPALAQYYDEKPDYDAAYADDYDEEIVVIAPGVQRERTGRRSSIGAPIEELTVQRLVTTADLDLRNDEDVSELYRRIRATARDACNEIDRASGGVMLTSDRECIRHAVRDATAQADDLVYYARG